jgi:hypothetical protein
VSAVLYHPGIDQHIVVDPDAVPQYRQSGWLLASEHADNLAQAAEAEEAARRADEAGAKHPARTTTKGEEK